MEPDVREGTIATIRAEFADTEGWPTTKPLDRQRVRAWMDSPDLEVQGATYTLLHHKNGLARVQPPLDFAEYYAFVADYLRGCLCGYTDDPWDAGQDWNEAAWGSEATHATVYWFLDLWKDETVPRTLLEQTKVWLADILVDCPSIRGLLATAVYDHLLCHRRCRKFFADWEMDDRLARFVK